MENNIISVFDDYNAFIKENNQFITTLIKTNSKTIQRFSHVFKVCQHLYDLHNVKTLSEDEEIFFETGFDFIFDQIHILNSLFEIKFNKDYKELEKCAKSINLLLYINEFKSEALNLKNTNKAFKKLIDLESNVDNMIDKKEIVPDEYFQLLNDIVDELFEGIDLELVTDIFYEVALEYDLIEENDTEYNDIISNQFEFNRKNNGAND